MALNSSLAENGAGEGGGEEEKGRLT